MRFAPTNMIRTADCTVSNQCVSVVVPTSGDRLSMLRRAILSIAPSAQYVQEILVVDDHLNNSIHREQVRELVESDFSPVPIKLFYTEGGVGASAARNLGVAFAEGDYICFLDDDDEMLAEGIAKRLDMIRRHDADFVLGDFFRCGSDSRKCYIRIRLGNLSEYLVAGYCQTPSIMVKAGVREKVVFPAVPKFQDYLYVLEMLIAGFSGLHLNQAVYLQHLEAGERMAYKDNKLEAWQHRIAIEKRALVHIAPTTKRQVRFRWKMELIKSGIHDNPFKSLTWLAMEITQLRNKQNIALYGKACLAVLLPKRILRSIQHYREMGL